MDLLKVKDVADTLRLSPATVYRLVHSGSLEGVRVGRSIRVHAASVQNYVRDNPVTDMGNYGGMVTEHQMPLFEDGETQ